MKLLFLDLETTGLDEKQGAILEVAAIAMDGRQELARFHALVRQPDSVIGLMDKWCIDMHTKTGLLAAMLDKGIPWEAARALLGDFISHWFGTEEKARLAGYSVQFDLRWLARHAPDLPLSHRIIDVSTLRDIFSTVYGVKLPAGKEHRATADVEEALGNYLSILDALPPAAAWLASANRFTVVQNAPVPR